MNDLHDNLSYTERLIVLIALASLMIICIFRIIWLDEMVFPEMFLIAILILGEGLLMRRQLKERSKGKNR